MRILVCISNVPDTTTKIRFKDDNRAFDSNGVQWIINPWDELALTRALELKEGSGGAIDNVTVINVGLADTEPTLRKALAIGADKAVRINAEAIDAFFVAAQIAAYLKKEPFDLVLNGIESSDYNGSGTGGMLAEMLDLPSVSSVSGVDFSNGQFNIRREIEGGYEMLRVPAPVVAVVQKGIALDPRIPSMRGIMMARTKPLEVVAPDGTGPLTSFVRYELPPPKKACRMIAPDNAKELIHLLQNEARII
jgi:electron transfer flavoprotein beta subunit